MKDLAIFRCDASPEIGAGHAARCLALADAFADAGSEVLFAVNAAARETFPALKRFRTEIVPAGKTDEPQWLGELADGKNASLVLDLRETSEEYEAACKRWTKKLAIIADFPDRRHDCDVLIDQTIGREAREYASLVPENCKILTGAQFALVGRPFAGLRGEAQQRRKGVPAKRILLTFGATDPFNYLGRLLPALIEHASGLKIDIAAGSRPLDDVQVTIERQVGAISVLRDAEEMPQALLAADLAVGLAGTSAWERCVLGLPSALFIPSDYYRLATERLAATGAVTVIGGNDFEPADMARKIVELTRDAAKLAQMSARAFTLCDGKGAARIVNALR